MDLGTQLTKLLSSIYPLAYVSLFNVAMTLRI